MKLIVLAVLLGVGSASAEPALVGGDENISRNAVLSGGAIVSGGSYALNYAVGETAASTLSGGSWRVESGVVPQLAQPGTVLAITAVTKSTGTLDLAWTAPGRDGNVGTVTGGYWRIDYSSEPAHVFAPTTYAVEIATTVTPGSAQAYRLTGLEANTTYYARVYLADAGKNVAETSDASEESTLANTPIAPTFTGVFATSVTISWTIPAGGAEGYGFSASSTNFGALFPGGTVVTSNTANGLAVTLTIQGLYPDRDYYFKLGSFNWQSQFNYDAVLSTRTGTSDVYPIDNLAMSADHLNRTVTLTWTNPVFAQPAGVTVVVSTSPISFSPTDGLAYPTGTDLGGGAVVASSVPTPGAAFTHTGLQLNVTTYFTLFSRDVDNSYSVGVSTQIVLDLPPMACAGLKGDMAADGSSITLRWAAGTSNMDGTPFRGASPIPWELDHYSVWRSTGIIRPTWVYVGTAPANATSYATALPVSGGLYFYKIDAHDAFQNAKTDQSMVVDTYGALYALSPDGVSRLRLGPQAASIVQAQANQWGQPLLVRAKDRPQDLGGRVVRSIDFEPVAAPTNRPAPFMLNGDASVTLRYEVVGGQVVPSTALGTAAIPLVPAVNLANAPDRLSAYVVGSNDSAKVFGNVDTVNQTVSLNTSFPGTYQIRTIFRDNNFSFDVSGVSNKVLTPNGDGLNDTVVFTFDNQRQSAVSGKVFDVRGGFIADMRPGPIGAGLDSLIWDGKGAGQTVTQGVYVYQIKAEGKTYNGTLVVIR